MIAPGSAKTLCCLEDQESHRLLFGIESFLRTLVRWELRGLNPAAWQGMIPAEVLSEAKARQDQERAICYVDVRKCGLLSYLTLSELKDIIIGPLWERAIRNHWPPLDLVQGEFKKLIAIRNKVAHFRPVTSRDLRVVNRFAEDLADWTRHYRRTREYSPSIGSSNGSDQWFEQHSLPNVRETWEQLSRDGRGASLELHAGVLSRHIAFSGHVPSGSINAGDFREFAERFESYVSFFRVGDLGESLCIYVPVKAVESQVKVALPAFMTLLENPVEGLSSEQVRAGFEFAEREGVVPWALALPIEFQV